MTLESDYWSDDAQVNKLLLSDEDIINSLTPEQIVQIVYSLGATRHEEKCNCLIFPTICHNSNVEDASMKLYYYFDRHIFKCYTECEEPFNIIELVRRVHNLNEIDMWYYGEAKTYVLDFLSLKNVSITQSPYVPIKDRYRRHIGATQLPEYSQNILYGYLSLPYCGWIDEGMSVEAIRKFNVKFSISHNAIIIPHVDIDGRLVGVRVRNLDYRQDGDMPKYCPLIISKNEIYSHSLSMNLYGLAYTKAAIKHSKKAIVYESEKSVILHQTYYGEDNNAVAVCGSNLSKPQVDLLIKNCQVGEIIIAFDKEFVDYDSDKAEKYFNKLYSIGKQYLAYANISFIYDSKNLLKEKDSPIDRGKDIFEQLYASRVKVV